MLRKIIHDEHGQDLIEYGLLGSFISIAAIASSSALAALSQTVASWPARRKARESDASVFASSSTISNCALLDKSNP